MIFHQASNLSSALCELGVLTPVLPVRTHAKALGIRKHIFQQLAAQRVRARVSKLNRLLNNVVDPLLDALQLRFTCEVLLNDVLLQGCDGVPCSIVGFLICAQSQWDWSNKLLCRQQEIPGDVKNWITSNCVK
jgi:hypothetical protein